MNGDAGGAGPKEDGGNRQERPQLTDEVDNQFLLLCLRGRWEPPALETARALVRNTGPDWDNFVQMAQSTAMAPLLYTVLRGQDLVPQKVERELGDAYNANALRNTFLFHELEGVIRRLAARGVDVILLKGAALSKTVYGTAAVRYLGDLDLLVRPVDVPAAFDVLSEEGYQSSYGERLCARDVLPYWNELLLVKRGQVETLIEVHWHLFSFPYYRYTVGLDWFWDTARPVRIGSTSALVLSPEAQLLHLCVHSLQHHEDSGDTVDRWLHDIAEVIIHHKAELDWDQVLSRTQAFSLVLPVQRILLRVSEAWQAPVPADVVEQLRALRPTPEEERAFGWFKVAAGGSVHRYSLAKLAGLPGWGPRLRFAWRCLLFPSPGFLRHQYRIAHPLLVPLYYPYRWLRGLRRSL